MSEIFFVLSDSYVQNQSRIAMKSPFYENDSLAIAFLLLLPAILGYKLSRVALGSRTRAGVSLHFQRSVAFHFFVRYVMECFMECFLKNITLYLAPCGAKQDVCKRRNNPGSKLWSTGRSCRLYEKGSRTHEPAGSWSALGERSFRVSCEEAWSCPLCFHH